MLDKTIDSALLNLRRQIVRGNLEGLDHVNALLAQRGIDPAKLPAVAKVVVRVKRGDTRRAILEALAGGPMKPVGVVRYLCQQSPDVPHKVARARVHPALARMAAGGLVVNDGGKWRLAQ